MSGLSTYQSAADFAEGWGLYLMLVVFVGFGLWPFRPGARDHNETAAHMIFKDENDGE
ncbi:MAG TPA: cbb3-type cytochrome c oxidase subunit 3 [Croceibacterium sp.]|nr:cbb3-type cytochrome c oxidase subunit 3 [Croceibacterium sp.]